MQKPVMTNELPLPRRLSVFGFFSVWMLPSILSAVFTTITGVTVTVAFGTSIVDYSTSLEASGRLTFSFIVTLSGAYSISVFVALNKTSVLDYVLDAPMTFVVSHSEVSSVKTVLRSPFLTITTAGVLSSIQIFAKDSFDNPVVNVASALLSAQLFASPREVPQALLFANVTAVESTPGLLNVTYVHNHAGSYHMEIRLNNRHLQSSPFAVNAQSGIVDPASTFISLGTLNGGIVPLITTFTIDYVDKFGNPASAIDADAFSVLLHLALMCPPFSSS